MNLPSNHFFSNFYQFYCYCCIVAVLFLLQHVFYFIAHETRALLLCLLYLYFIAECCFARLEATCSADQRSTCLNAGKRHRQLAIFRLIHRVRIKKGATTFSTITSAFLGRFVQFFYQRKQE